MEKLEQCPVCGNHIFKEFLKGADLFLTGQEFTIVECNECGFRFTNPRPDKVEILPFYESPDYIAHNTEQGTLLESVYKFVRKYALANKYKIVKAYSQGKDILDIGCGTGEFLNYCKGKGLTVTGIEPNPKARKFAADHFSIEVKDEDYLDHLPPAGFDIITMWHVLEHVHLLDSYFQRISQALKKNGTLIIAVPNSNSWDAKKYKKFWAAYDLPRHLYHFTPATFKKLAEKNNFSLIKIMPLKFDAFYISLLSEKYKTKKQNYLKGFYNGLRSNFFGGNDGKNYSSLIYICKASNNAK